MRTGEEKAALRELRGELENICRYPQREADEIFCQMAVMDSGQDDKRTGRYEQNQTGC
jgi:hypothetical protein